MNCKSWNLIGFRLIVDLNFAHQFMVAMQALKGFLDATQFVIEKCCGIYSTQSNESLHRRKLKFATKDVKWGFTWHARAMVPFFHGI